ncbi:MAG: IS1182 family transposase [Planctomycetes bacterium]|nr:IS1182 family transposase [Planctomycetota bacterium]
MAEHFVNIDRDAPMLLPPDLRDWVPEDDMVHFVIEAVAGMNLPTLKINRRGSGSAQYPPKMMLQLLIYCYANGLFSSRRIERATYRDVAVRFLTADTHPDHDTICTFRRENSEAVSEAFLQVLQLARSLGVLKVGTVSVDGTHVRANASKDKNVRYDRAGELEEQLKLDIAELLAKADQTDQREENDGQSLPDDIARRERLLERMQQARKELEERAQARAVSEQAEYERKVEARNQRPGKGKGKKIPPPKDTPDDHEQVNLTDSDSRLMRKNKREGYTQSYNGQAGVDADGSQLILSNHVSQCASDANELEPAVHRIPACVGAVSAALADSGYVNADAMERLEASGKDLYVAVGRDDGNLQRTYDYRPRSTTEKPAKVVKDPRLLAMQEKLKTDEGRALYAKRKQTVEPVFGIIKSVMGFRQFLLRGLAKVSGEWDLVCLAYNVKRLWALKTA